MGAALHVTQNCGAVRAIGHRHGVGEGTGCRRDCQGNGTSDGSPADTQGGRSGDRRQILAAAQTAGNLTADTGADSHVFVAVAVVRHNGSATQQRGGTARRDGNIAAAGIAGAVDRAGIGAVTPCCAGGTGTLGDVEPP